MEGFATGFLTGFMGDQAEKISKRKSVAEEYFQNQMELAKKKDLNYNKKKNKKIDDARKVDNKMIDIGVIKDKVMAIDN